MKREIICSILSLTICLLSNNLAAQELTPQKDETTEKWGYVNNQGKVVIPYKYEIADKFSDGLAAVALGDKAGYINKAGKIILPLQYDGASSFKNNFAVVVIDSKHGLIDKTGKQIIPCQYEQIKSLGEEGYSVVFENKMGYFDNTGKQIIPFEYISLALIEGGFAGQTEKGGYWKKIDKEGKKVE